MTPPKHAPKPRLCTRGLYTAAASSKPRCGPREGGICVILTYPQAVLRTQKNAPSAYTRCAHAVPSRMALCKRPEACASPLVFVPRTSTLRTPIARRHNTPCRATQCALLAVAAPLARVGGGEFLVLFYGTTLPERTKVRDGLLNKIQARRARGAKPPSV